MKPEVLKKLHDKRRQEAHIRIEENMRQMQKKIYEVFWSDVKAMDAKHRLMLIWTILRYPKEKKNV